MIVYLAGLTQRYRLSCTTRPRSMGPAAGAQLRHVTVPLMTPVIFYTNLGGGRGP